MSIEKIGDYFYQDCRVFVAKFKKKGSLRFDAFADVWQEMKFSFVLFPWKMVGEMVEFVEVFLKVCKKVWLKSRNINERVCGLYLLRAIYLKQPAEHYVKIKLSHDEWQLMKQFLYVIKDVDHNEIRYVLQELFDSNAFAVSVPDNVPADESKESALLEESAAAHFIKARTMYTQVFDTLAKETSEYMEKREAVIEAFPEIGVYSNSKADNLVEQLKGRLKIFEREVGKIRDVDSEDEVANNSTYDTDSEDGQVDSASLKRKRRSIRGRASLTMGSESEETSNSDQGEAILDMPRLHANEDSNTEVEGEGTFCLSPSGSKSVVKIHLSDYEITPSEEDCDDEDDTPLCYRIAPSGSSGHPDLQPPHPVKEEVLDVLPQPTVAKRERRYNVRSAAPAGEGSG